MWSTRPLADCGWWPSTKSGCASWTSWIFATLGLEGRIDYVLLRSDLRYQIELLEREGRLAAELQGLVPFLATIAALQEARRDLDPVDPREAAVALQELAEQVETLRGDLEASLASDAGDAGIPSRIVALRASRLLESLQDDLESWYDHYAGYDPLFTWWSEAPHAALDSALTEYTGFVREDLVGIEPGEDEPIVGDPIGADGMRADLEHEMIAYTPEELIEIGEREFAWCEAGDDSGRAGHGLRRRLARSARSRQDAARRSW